MGKYDALFTPMKVGKIELKNRISMAPMGGTQLVFRGQYSPESAQNFLTRAKGGAGLLVTGSHAVSDRWGRKGFLHDDRDIFIPPTQKLMKEIHSYGAKVFMEVSVGQGRNLNVTSVGSNTGANRDTQLRVPKDADLAAAMRAPSELPNFWVPARKHREITREEIYEIIDAYGKAAVMIREAGIDGIDVHAIHEGYMLDEFVQANLNHRTDEFGGSLENRLRFATLIVKEIKKTAGADFPVSMRYSVVSKMKGFNKGALPGEYYEEFGRNLTESPMIVKLLEDAGYDMLTADNGCYESFYYAHPPAYMPMCCNLPESVYIRQFINIPVVVAGRMEELSISARAVETGAIDGIMLGRQLLCDPEWPQKVQREALDDIRPCIACHNGCFGRLQRGLGTSCALNPSANQEGKYKITAAAKKKKVLVVGGGFGGMEAARVATLRGHDVTVLEKSGKLGGVFNAAAAFDFKEADKKLIAYFAKQMKDLNIDVRLNTEATPWLIAQENPDAVIIATGAATKRLPVPGTDKEHVVYATDFLSGDQRTGVNVAIVGGGITGCEIAYSVAKRGRKVTLLEMKDEILDAPEISDANRFCLKDLLALHNVDIYPGAMLKEVTGQGLIYRRGDNEYTMLADTVIMCTGYDPVNSLKDAVSGPEVHIVGDAGKVGNLLDAIWGAWDVTMTI